MARKPSVYRHIDDVTVSAVFSACQQFRYQLIIDHLRRTGGETLCVVMQNPSAADISQADRTIQFVEKLVFNKGYPQFERITRLVVVNLYAYIQTTDFVGDEQWIGADNDTHLQQALGDADQVLIGWGRSMPSDERLETIHRFLRPFDSGTLWQTLRHPSRGRYHDFILPYDGVQDRST